MNINEKATCAKRLRDDEAFQTLISEVRDTAISRFLTSGAPNVDAREQAHSLIRAINEIDNVLQSWADAKTVADKKGQHRGSD